MNNKRPLPLRPRHKNRPHLPLRRQRPLQSLNMRLLPRKTHTRPRIHTELDHLIPIIQQKIPKRRRALPLLRRPHGQIKRHHQPAHFELLCIHGLYARGEFSKTACRNVRTTPSIQPTTSNSPSRYSNFTNGKPVTHFRNSFVTSKPFPSRTHCATRQSTHGRNGSIKSYANGVLRSRATCAIPNVGSSPTPKIFCNTVDNKTAYP